MHPPPHFPAGDEVERLVERARNGDAVAWAALYRQYWRLLLVQARAGIPAALRGRFDAEDVAQATFLAAFRALGSHAYRGESAFRAWLKEINRHELTSRVRNHLAAKRSPARECTPDGDEHSAPQSLDETPSQVLARSQQLRSLLEALEQLAPQARWIVRQRELEGRTWGDLAREMGCTPKAARRRHALALTALWRRLRR